MKKDRIRGEFTIDYRKRGFGFQTVASFAFVYMHRSELQSAAGVSPIPTVVMEIPKEVCNLKDRRSDLYEVRVKK